MLLYKTSIKPEQCFHLFCQQGTGKEMNQSPQLYTPTICTIGTEKTAMPMFHEMIAELQKIEKAGYIEVDGQRRGLHVKVAVVGDKSFMWKFTGRGKGSASGQFCWMCKCAALQRHKGQPGGCRKCKEEGQVHMSDGRQKCLHYDIVTERGLVEEKERLEWLRQHVKADMPLTVRPVWRNVQELREHCKVRATMTEWASMTKWKEPELQKYLLAKTNTGCKLGASITNGVMHCDVALVRKELALRRLCSRGTPAAVRSRLRTRLQLEEELMGLEAADRDRRFHVEN